MHDISYASYPVEWDKKKIEEYVNETVKENSDCHSGLYKPIRWYDGVKPLGDYDEAEEFLKEHENGDYDNLAVQYYVFTDKCFSKKLLELQQKREGAWEKYKDTANAPYFENAKADFISCKHCGSKINRKCLINYCMRKNKCPVCGEELRPESALKKIESLQTAYNKIDKQYKEEEKRLAIKNGVVNWLVKYEYHV